MEDYYSDFFKFLKEKGFKTGKIKGIHELNKPHMIVINNKSQEIWYLLSHKGWEGYRYFFGIEREYLKKLNKYNGYVIFGCGSIKNIFKIPANFLIEKLRYTSVAIKDNNYKINITEKFGEFRFKVPNGQEINIEKFRFK